MKVRTFLEITVTVLVIGGALVRWSRESATSPAAAPIQPPAVDDAAARYTHLHPNRPDGIPDLVPYASLGADVEYPIPADTEPTLWRNDWREGLTNETGRLYEEGLVRSGMEDLELCKPGYTCHAAVRYRVDEQNRSDVPHEIRLQVTFTTRKKYSELYFYWQEGRTKVWSITNEGWHYHGVVEDLPEPGRTKFLKLMSVSFHG